ncbi:MAG: glycosyl transferase family 1 [Chloroflexi bacterium]|nr:MAG: glycosyl transferase family 1 [Chloroflexota bacterium]
MKIALVGTRGIPANYSGFETCAEELGVRLVERGHQVTVYCRSHHITYAKPYYRGVRLVRLPTIPNKYLDTIAHTTLAALHTLTQDYDVVLMFIAGNSPLSFVPRLGGKKVALNVDGLDWKRRKWPPLAKKYIQFAEWLATKLPNRVITDSRQVQQYYQERFGAATTYIAYGADVLPAPPGEQMQRYGLEPQKYILFVGRLVPENCAHHLVAAFDRLKTEMRCVIVGDAPYAGDYIEKLKAMAGPRVIFTGYVYGEGYQELSSHAYVFVETSEVGGTHPALLEAMAFGNAVVVNDTRENLETIGDAGLTYDGSRGAEALAETLQELIDQPERTEAYRLRAKERVRQFFTWDAVTDEYEALFKRMLDN